MGVKGFWKNLESFLDFHELMIEFLQPGASVLLIDGNNLMFQLLFLKVREDTNTILGSPIDGRYGGSYDEYREIIIREFKKLQSFGFKKIEVYFDGKSPPLKKLERNLRGNSINQQWASLYDVLIALHTTYDLTSLPLPKLTKRILETVLRRDLQEIDIINCQNEADLTMGQRCQKLNNEGIPAFIYSNDSDFAVMPGCALIKTGTFHNDAFHIAAREDIFDISKHPIEVWRREKVRNVLGIEEAKFNEFLLVCGSDFTRMLPRDEMVFRDVSTEVLQKIGGLKNLNNDLMFEKILYLVKNSGNDFKVCAPSGSLFSELQEHSLEYSRRFWSLTLDLEEDDKKSRELIERIPEEEFSAFETRVLLKHQQQNKNEVEEEEEVLHLDESGEHSTKNFQSSEVDKILLPATVFSDDEFEDDDDDEGLLSVGNSIDDESLNRFEPEFSDEFLNFFSEFMKEYPAISFNEIPLLVLDFIDHLLKEEGLIRNVNTTDEVENSLDMFREEIESFTFDSILALKISLFASYDSVRPDVDVVLPLEKRLEIIGSLRNRIPDNVEISEWFKLDNDGGIDLVSCYKSTPLYDNFVMSHLYQLLVDKCISKYTKKDDFLVENTIPELFFHGPLFHSIYEKMKNKKEKEGEEELNENTKNDFLLELKTSAEDYRAQFLEKLESDRLIFISGDTGCGKSSRIPTFILQDCRKKGLNCRILVCEPKRLGAEKLYHYVRGATDQLGIPGATLALRMGLGVREGLEQADLTFATAGYVCQRYIGERTNTLTHVVIDEIHERTVDTDLLFMWTRALLRWRDDVKVILMSATPEYKLLRRYYRDYLECASYLDFESERTGLTLTNPILALNNGLGDLQPLWVGNTPKEKVIYFIEDLKRVKGVEQPFDRLISPKFLASREYILFRYKEGSITASRLRDQIFIAVQLISLCARGRCVLLFLAGRPEIDEMRSRLRSISHAEVVEVHGDIDEEESQALLSPITDDKIRVVLATNAAESSVTLPAVDIVIDFGTNNIETYDSQNFARTLLKTTWVSKSSSKQRAGRTGRVTDGTVYRLYSRKTYKKYCSSEVSADVVKKPLHDAMIRVLGNFNGNIPGAGGISRVLNSLVQVPELSHREDSLNYLFEGKLISDNTEQCRLTRLGRFASMDSVGTQLSRLIFYGIVLGIGAQCVVLAAALTTKGSPFRGKATKFCLPDEFNENLRHSYLATMKLDNGVYSEAIMMVFLFKKLKSTNKSKTKWYEVINEYNLHDGKTKTFYSTVNALIERVNKLLKSWGQEALEYNRLRVDKDFISLMRIALLWSSDGSIMKTVYPPKLDPVSARFDSILFRIPISKEKILTTFPVHEFNGKVNVKDRFLYLFKINQDVQLENPRGVLKSFFSAQDFNGSQLQGLLIWFKSSLILGTTHSSFIPPCDVVVRKMVKRTQGLDDVSNVEVQWLQYVLGNGETIYCTEINNVAMTCHDDAREFLQLFDTFFEIICEDLREDSYIYLRSLGLNSISPDSMRIYLENCFQVTCIPVNTAVHDLPTFKVLQFPTPHAASGDVQPSPKGMNYLNFITVREKKRTSLYVGSLDHRLSLSTVGQNVPVLIDTEVKTEKAKWEILNVNNFLNDEPVDPPSESPPLWDQAHTDSWSSLLAMHPMVADRSVKRPMYGITNHATTIEKGDYKSVRCEQVSFLPYPSEWIQSMMSVIKPTWRSRLSTSLPNQDPFLLHLAGFIDETISAIATDDNQRMNFSYNIPLSQRVLDFHRVLLNIYDDQVVTEEIVAIGEEDNLSWARCLIPDEKVGIVIGKKGAMLKNIKSKYNVSVLIEKNVEDDRGVPMEGWALVIIEGGNVLYTAAARDFVKWLVDFNF